MSGPIPIEIASRETVPRAREGSIVSRCFLRSPNFLLQNPAILRNAARITLPLVSSEKHAVQHPEKLRKQPCLNYNQLLYRAELRGIELPLAALSVGPMD